MRKQKNKKSCLDSSTIPMEYVIPFVSISSPVLLLNDLWSEQNRGKLEAEDAEFSLNWSRLLHQWSEAKLIVKVSAVQTRETVG